ncbi:MAG: hypothetical protein AAFQ87_19600, partial [Bacteroidota bacterium]
MSEQGSFIPEKAIKGKVYRWVQFFDLPDEKTLVNIEKLGIELLEYVPYNTYLATFPVSFDLKKLSSIGIRSVTELGSNEKMGPMLFESEFPSHALQGDKLNLRILTMPNLDLNAFAARLRSMGAEIEEIAPNYGIIEGWIPTAVVYQLIAETEIRFAEIMQAPGQPEDIRGKSLHRSSAISSNYPGGRNYDGSGVNIQVRDDGGLGPHVDFKGRENQTYINNFGPLTQGTQHGDRVSGSAGGAGNIDPTVVGSATGSTIFNTNYVASFLDITLALHTEEQVMITNSSYSNGCNAGYTNTSRTVDVQMFENE